MDVERILNALGFYGSAMWRFISLNIIVALAVPLITIIASFGHVPILHVQLFYVYLVLLLCGGIVFAIRWGLVFLFSIILLMPVVLTGASESLRVIGPLVGLAYTIACAINLALYAYTGVLLFYAGVPGPDTEIADAFDPGRDTLKYICKVSFCLAFVSFFIGIGAHLVPVIPLIVALGLGILVGWGSLATKGDAAFRILFAIAQIAFVIMVGITGLLGLEDAGWIALPALHKVRLQLALWHMAALTLLAFAIGSQIIRAMSKDEDTKNIAGGLNILAWWAAAFGVFSWLALAGNRWGGGLFLILEQFALVPFVVKLTLLVLGYAIARGLHHDEHKIAKRIGYILRKVIFGFAVVYFVFWVVTTEDHASSLMKKMKSGTHAVDTIKNQYNKFQNEKTEGLNGK